MQNVVYSLNKINFFKSQSYDKDLFIQDYENDLLNLMEYLRSRTFTGILDRLHVETRVQKQLFNGFNEELQPCRTSMDGNCLWNMISICLSGNETFMYILRALTVYTIVKLKKFFVDKIIWEYTCDVYSFMVEEDEINKRYDELIFSARVASEFGCQFHLLALSTLLDRHIFIYTKFTHNKIYESQSLEELKSTFSKDPNVFGKHVNYHPIKNEHLKARKDVSHEDIPLYGFFETDLKHFTALIPKNLTEPIYVPCLKWYAV